VIARRRVRVWAALLVLAIGPAACSSHRPSSSQGVGAIVRASVHPAGVSWVQFADGRTALSDDAGQSWQAVRAPQPPALGASIALSGHVMTVAAVSGTTLTVQRSGDDGATWSSEAHELVQPADAADVVASPDGHEVAVAASLPGASGATDGHAQLLIGPAEGTLVDRATPGGPDVAWSGSRLLMPGGPLRSRLYLSPDEGRSWTPQGVIGPVAPDHDVAPDAPVFGSPVSVAGGAVIPVTTHTGSQTEAALYRTTDGRTFDQIGRLSLGPDIGPGVGVVASSYGDDSVVVADPFSTVLHVFAGGVEHTVAGAGLPGPVDSISFDSATDGLAQVTVRGCSRGKSDCIDELRIYRTSDGGASWQRATP
jgi:hypothetical protein